MLIKTMITNNPNPETIEHQSTMVQHPASVLELDLLFRQRMQELRAEGAAELNALLRQRETKAANYWRKAELRKRIEDLRHEYRRLVAEDMQAEQEAEDAYRQFSQEQAARKAALQEWFNRERIRLAHMS